ncbi:MAG: acyl carrier protein [Saccharofermentans sp.]|nr:acyl carrier protein [Saccharofermentans sp.]
MEMNNEIAEQIKGMLVERLRIPADELEYDSELFGEDIGLDSIDSIEIIVGIENLFGVDISGAGATKEDFRSIETLTAFVEAHKEG